MLIPVEKVNSDGVIFARDKHWKAALTLIIKETEYVDVNIQFVFELGNISWFDWVLNFV